MPHHTLAARLRTCSLLAAVTAALATLSACQSSAQTGLLAGAGIGALAGQAIGGNTTATLIGTGVGAGVGYIIGNERDRTQARQITEQQQREIDELRAQQAASAQRTGSTAAPPRQPAPQPTPPSRVSTQIETGPLAGTRWNVISLSPRSVTDEFISMIVEFGSTGRVTTITSRADGAVDVANERYRVVGDTLIINNANYLINARFSINGDELVISADRFSAVLQRL